MHSTSMRAARLRGLQLVLLTSASIFATNAAAADAAQTTTTLSDIVVTARKTEENVQNVPITVNVLTAAALDAKGVSNLSQISGLAANVTWEDRGGSVRNKVTIRGVQSGETNSGIDPGVGFYVDDVYLANGISFNQTLMDIDHVEILKGPQGTLFGRNTTAGVISIHTTRPSLTDRYLDVEAVAGNYDLQQYRAVGNMPLSDDLALKLSGVYRDFAGYSFNTVSQSRVNGQHTIGGRAQLLYQPSDRLNIITSIDYSKDNAPQDLAECGLSATGAAGACTTAPSTNYVLSANGPNFSRREQWGASVAGNWTPEGWSSTLTSITAYRALKSSEFQDQDATAKDFLRSGFDVPKDWQFSQELRLATAQDKPLRGVAGAYYLHEDRQSNVPQTFGPDLLSLVGAPPGSISTVSTFNHQVLSTYAVFGQGSYDITPKLTAEVGLRYTYDTKSFTFSQTTGGLNLCPPLGFCAFPQFQGDHNWSAVTGDASLSYHVTDRLMAFAHYSRGYKSGGWNGNQLQRGTDPTVPYDPEYVDNYETGVKFESDDRRLRANLSGFYLNYNDIQLRNQGSQTQPQVVTNAGKAHNYGAELEINWVPLPGLQVDANGGMTRTHIDELKPGTPAFGPEFQFTPHATGSLTATYSHDLSSALTGVASATAAYRSDSWLTQVTSGANARKEPANTQVSARVGVEFASGRWGVYLSGRNLTNVRRQVFYLGDLGAPFPVFDVAFPNAPRTYQVELKGRF